MSWKTFKFFDKEVLKDPETKQPYQDLAGLNITCMTGGRGQIVLGDGQGRLHFLSLEGSVVKISMTPAYLSQVTLMTQLKQNNYVITVGFEETDQSIIKIWDCSKMERSGTANLLRTIKPQLPEKKPPQITCIAVDERQSLMAAGFVGGMVVLIKGNLVRYWSSRQQVLPFCLDNPITGLAFTTWSQDSFLFVTTEKATYSFNLSALSKGSSDRALRELGNFGCKVGCCVLSDSTQDHKFVVVNNYVTQFYLPHEPAQCLVFEGEMEMVEWFRGHLIEVRRGSDKPAATPSVPGVARDQYTLTVYDIQNQFIASTFPFTSHILGVVPEWGVLNVLTKDGRITQLREHDTQSKLENLFKRNLFDYAVALARNQSYDDGLAEILRRYGDHLYNKGDYQGAIEQYKNAIRHLEPSYVIRKYLDAQQIENLTSYLKALHDEGLAKSDHTTLLLNCYTKLADSKKLEEFIKKCKPGNFDVDAAIRVCRQSNFHRYAVELANSHSRHDLFLLIQVEDCHAYQEALRYIEKLPFDEAQTYLVKYGKRLMTEEPQYTSQVITSLCLGHWRQETLPPGQPAKRARPEDFIHIFVNQTEHLVTFLASSVENIPDCSAVVYNTLLEVYLSKDACKAISEEEREERVMRLLRSSEGGQTRYDVHHALVLAETHHFQAAVLYLYEHRLNMFQPILQFHMEHHQHEQVMETCGKHGHVDTHLWVLALQYFAREESEHRSQYIHKILEQVDHYNLLPPLVVIEILSKSRFTKLGDVKDYIAGKLHTENDAIARDERQIKTYQESTQQMKGQLEELRTKARVFQVMKCETCKSGLRLPAVHFLCQHSYHLSCLEEGEDGHFRCPVCQSDNQTVIAVLQELDSVTNVNEEFHRQLEKKRHDGFSVVADYFGRGVMNKASGGKVATSAS